MVKLTKTDRLDRAFGALADPTRRRIISDVARRERTVGSLAEQFDISFVAVWKHVRVLREAGLIAVSAERPRVCTLAPNGMSVAADWMAAHGAFWQAELDQVGRFLKSAQRPSPPTRP